MTEQHPLTDEIIVELIGDRNLFFCLTEDDMRTAADWQLIQVLEFIKKEDTVYADYIYKAMRPQQQEDK